MTPTRKTAPPASRKRSTSDTNGAIAALLRDLAAVQASKQSAWGYKRAAATIQALTEPIENFLLPDGSLRKIPNIGPSSSRVILEVLTTGTSATVEQALQASPKRTMVIERRDAGGEHFLSGSQVAAALKDPRLRGPSLADYRGDLQMHSVDSDGRQTLDAIIDAAIERGYEYCAVTDHSYGLQIAGGVSMEDLARQHAEIDRLNKRYRRRFRLLKGIEANIRPDGTVDMTPEELDRLEIVVAAPHSGLRSPQPQTSRMITAVRTMGVHILGHPRGRKYGSRPGITADWDRVFEVAAQMGVAIEIDGDPSRQDVDFTLAKRALAAGCLFALDSDAHSTHELQYVENAIAHARLAGLPKERIVNCWPLAQLLEWAAIRRRA
jgi:histidinol phosphatase-like PHP family hydrolase